MDVDAKTVGTVLVSLLLGGGGGVATSQVHLAALETQVEEVDQRIDRMDARKANQ